PYEKIILAGARGATVTRAPAREESLGRVAVGGERDAGSASLNVKGQAAAGKQEAGAKERAVAETKAPEPMAQAVPAPSPAAEKADGLKDKLAKRADQVAGQTAPQAAMGTVRTENDRLQAA